VRVKLLFSLLFLFVFHDGCAASQAVRFRQTVRGPQYFRELPVNWSFACEFPSEQMAPVREGFTYWNKLVDAEIFREAPACGVAGVLPQVGPRLLVVFDPGVNKDDKVVLGTAHVGLFDGVPRSAVVSYYGPWAALKSEATKATAARHEAGHVLGFAHSDFDWCLMYPKVDVEKYSKKKKGVCKPEAQEARRFYRRQEKTWVR
jgi:hypothetical protein